LDSSCDPLSNKIARPLAEGLKNEVVCREDRITRIVPQKLLNVREAIHAALSQVESHLVETNWTMAGPMPGDPDWSGGTVFRDEREVAIAAPARDAFRAVCRLGGPAGSRYAQVRRRSRLLASGRFGAGSLLSLRAEMRLPGQALLDFRIGANGGQNCTLRQTALFEPRGLFGLMYWYAVLPLHGVVFRGMLKGIRRDAVRMAAMERVGSSEPAQGGCLPLLLPSAVGLWSGIPTPRRFSRV
jgi:hypothetical protein